MKRVVIGIFVSMLMIGSVLTSATLVQNEIKFDDGEITVTIEIGDYQIENTQEGIEIKVDNFGHYLIAGKPNLPAKIPSEKASSILVWITRRNGRAPKSGS